MTTATAGPEELWLQLYGDGEPDDGPPPDYTDAVSWCWHQIYDHDVRYVRADSWPAIKAETNKINLANLRAVMHEWHRRAVSIGFDGVADVLDSAEAMRLRPLSLVGPVAAPTPRDTAPSVPSADTMDRITRGIEQYAAHHPSPSAEALRDAVFEAAVVAHGVRFAAQKLPRPDIPSLEAIWVGVDAALGAADHGGAHAKT